MNGNSNEFERELISAYLDDVLNSSEHQQIEQLLANDDQAARYLEQLRTTRECLRSVARSSVRSSIAERVIRQARAVAAAEGLSPDHHVLRDNDPAQQDSCLVVPSSLVSCELDVSSSNWLPRSNRLLWSALVATAAAIVCMVAVPNFFDPVPQSDALISHILPDGLTNPDAPPLVSSQAADGQGEIEPSPFDSIASALEPKYSEPEREDVKEPRLGAPVRNDPSNMAFDYLMTVNIVMSEDAWKSSYFDALLEAVGVPIANPITADDELTKLLDESRVTVGSTASTNASGAGRAALLFVRAKGKVVDKLLLTVARDQTHFHSLSYDLSIDPQRMLLRRLLSQRSDSPAGEVLGARVVRSSGETLVSQELVPNFVPSDLPKTMESSNPGGMSMSALNPLADSDPIAEMLIILREPKSQ